MSSRLYEEIVSQRGRLEELVARLPGFKGYHEKQARRTADRLLRDYLTTEIDRSIKAFIQLEKKVLDGGKGLKYMGRTREVKDKLQAYHDKVATAAPKYSGMFAQIKIDEQDLDRIYAFDEAQFRFLAQFDDTLATLEKVVSGESDTDLETALDDVYRVATRASDAFSLRDDEILRLGKGAL